MIINPNIFVPLLTSHLITDFILQSSEDVRLKHQPMVFIKHLILTSITAYALLGIWTLWILIPVIFILHGFIDLLKLVLNNKLKNHRFILFAADQVFHIAALLLLTYLISGSHPGSGWPVVFGSVYIGILITLSALIITTKAGGIAVGLFVQPFVEQLENFESRGFVNGGKIIGYLERFLIVLLIFTGNFPGVGFLIAAKSVFRFGELFNSQNRKEAEYIIIGTFFSFAYAVVTGLLFHLSMNLFVYQSL